MDFKAFSDKTRGQLADEGKAMPDGSYPIENVNDLRNAIQAVGRAKDVAATKAHIIKRAKALDAVDQLPEGWSVTASGDNEESAPETAAAPAEAAPEVPLADRITGLEEAVKAIGGLFGPED